MGNALQGFDANTGDPKFTLKLPNKGKFNFRVPIAVSDQGRVLAVCSEHNIFLVDARTGDLFGTVGQPLYNLRKLTLSPNGKLLFAVNESAGSVTTFRWDLSDIIPDAE